MVIASPHRRRTRAGAKALSLWLYVSLILAHGLVLFALIPAATHFLHNSYNLNEYADGYDQLARNLVDGNGYKMYPDTASTLTREPGYPLVLACLFKLFGENLIAVKMTNMALAFGTAWWVTCIARRFSRSRLFASGPPLLFLFCPGTLAAESRGGVELLFSFCLMAFLVALYKAIETNAWLDYLVSGAVLGAATLVRSTPMLFPVPLLLMLLVRRRSTPTIAVVGRITAMIGMMLVVLSPWIIRNYGLTGKFIPTASVLGISADAGLYDVTHYGDGESWAAIDTDGARARKKVATELGYPYKNIQNAYYQDFYATGDEIRFSDYLLHRVISTYKAQPLLFFRNVCLNFFNLWFRGKTSFATLFNVCLQLPFLILTAIGLWICKQKTLFGIALPSLLLVLYMTGLYVTILAQARYSVPLVPILAVFAWIPLFESRRRFSLSIRRPDPIA